MWIWQTLILLTSALCAGSRSVSPDYPREEITVSKGTEKWGYVTVRPEAHMFWWLYKSTSIKGSDNVPLVLWLQGGPGASGTGFGNFMEIGPLDVNLKPRNTTWLSVANLLFVDNPVGTGFSYVDSDKAYTTNIQEIAEDLLALFKAFIKANEDMSSVPLYIFSESYGGKMAAAFSQVLYKAIHAGEVKSNFHGFAMGDSWIVPNYCTYLWADFLYFNSLVDYAQYGLLKETAMRIADYIAHDQWDKATDTWGALEGQVEEYTDGIDFYNILKWDKSQRSGATKMATPLERAILRHIQPVGGDSLSQLMNGPIRKKLGCIPQNVTWQESSSSVFLHQKGDFMKNVTAIVDSMIENTSLAVVVYNGQWDLIVETISTEGWVYKLKIGHAFEHSKKEAMLADGVPYAFVKTVKNFQFYYIMGAGHMVPMDNGYAALQMLKRVLGV